MTPAPQSTTCEALKNRGNDGVVGLTLRTNGEQNDIAIRAKHQQSRRGMTLAQVEAYAT